MGSLGQQQRQMQKMIETEVGYRAEKIINVKKQNDPTSACDGKCPLWLRLRGNHNRWWQIAPPPHCTGSAPDPALAEQLSVQPGTTLRCLHSAGVLLAPASTLTPWWDHCTEVLPMLHTALSIITTSSFVSRPSAYKWNIIVTELHRRVTRGPAPSLIPAELQTCSSSDWIKLIGTHNRNF